MPIMVVITPNGRKTLDISTWSEQAKAAVQLSLESDGYQVTLGYGRP